MGTVAKIVAASMGVEVVFDASADTASTDGTRIIIPTSLIGNGDAHAAILMRGFIAHEGVGHIRHTDMAAWRAFAQDASPLGKSILNIIEDIRIERLACKVYPGIKRILNETVEALKPEGFFDLPTKPHPAGVITGLLLNCLRAEELGQALDPIPARAMAFKMFGLSLRDDILNIASNGSRGCSTAEAVDATKAILKLLGEFANTVANPLANPYPKPEHFPETMDDQAGEDASGSETGSEAGSVSKQAPSPSQQRSLKQSKSAAKALTATADDCGPSGLEEITQKAMEMSVGASQGLDEMPRSIVASPLQNWRPSVRSAGISRTLSRKLEDVLQSRVDEEDFSVRGGGRLDAKRVSRTRVLDLEVFEREGKEAQGLDTALFVLVDKSGSMSSPIGTSSDTTEAVALDAVSAL
jgi:cobalamin biosynthesis protein CobT